MNVPKVKFKRMTLKENIDTIKWAYYEDNGQLLVRKYVISYFPELKKLNNSSSKKEVYKKIEKLVTSDYNTYEKRIDEEVNRYNKIWNKYNDNYFLALSSYLNVKWPSTHKTINASVGLIPVFPRNLDEFSFSVSTGLDLQKIIEVTAHESLHFLWFEKWKELYPEISRDEYDSPYISWQYSEMVTDPILNNKPFCDIFSFKENGYDSFYKIYYNQESVMDNLRKIYSDQNSIENNIKTGFNYLNKVLKKSIKR